MSTENNENKIEPSAKLSLPKAILCAGVLIALAILVSNGSLNRGEALTNATEQAVLSGGESMELLNPVSEADFMQGAEDPEITIVEFSDFGCSFCKSFHPTLYNVINAYPEDVAWVYRHLPFRNKQAALASECVGQRLGDEAFWSYADALFTYFPDINDKVLTEEALKLGFENEQSFLECLSSPEVSKGVEEDNAEARLIGANGTPHSLVITKDGRVFPIRGASSEAQVLQIIELLLAQK